MTTSNFQLTFVEERKRNWRSFGLSFAAQSLGVVLLVQFGVINPQQLINPRHNTQPIALTAPEPEPQAHPTQNILVKHAPVEPKFVAPKLEMARLDTPIHITEKPKVKLAEVEPPRVVLNNFPAPQNFPKVAPPKLAPQVQTGVFSEGSSAKPTLAKTVDPRNVQTGGFGEPNGINGTAKGEAKLVAARMGGFDMPTGPGYGNGTGGANGQRGTIASAGFGNCVATQTPNIPSGRAVHQSGFGDTRPASELPRQAKAVPALSPASPVEILSKPVPTYTAEARDLKLEGEVLLEVNFSADGTPNILRVVRGLGHGLDEAAVKAAQRIKYKPAKREGQPVDSVAMLHVVFQLAY